MHADRLRKLLEEVRAGVVSVGHAMERLHGFPYEDLGFATLDNHRALRQGFPEVILCQGKTVEQVGEIARAALDRHPVLLATRASPEAYETIRRIAPAAEYNLLGRTVVVRREAPPAPAGRVLIVTAGTADIPVAEPASTVCWTGGTGWPRRAW
jgi:NCAIR mutase (PurE)-related protein